MRQLTFEQLDKLSSVLVIPHLIMLRLLQVLMVFSALVIPGVVALLFTNSFSSALRVAWGAGALAIIGGIGASFYWDLPTGPLLVCAFGLLVVVAAAFRAVLGIRPDPKIIVQGLTDEGEASRS